MLGAAYSKARQPRERAPKSSERPVSLRGNSHPEIVVERVRCTKMKNTIKFNFSRNLDCKDFRSIKHRPAASPASKT
jgi:hypothetical protein